MSAWRVLRLYALLWFAPRHVTRDFPSGGSLSLWLGPPFLGLLFSGLAMELHSLLAQLLPLLYSQLFELLPSLRHHGIVSSAREPANTLLLMWLEFIVTFHLFAFCYARLAHLADGRIDGIDCQRAVLWALWLLVPPILLGGGTVYFAMLAPLAQGLAPGASVTTLLLLLLSLAGLLWGSLVGCLLLAERSGLHFARAAVFMLISSVVVAVLLWPLRFWHWS